MKRLALKLFFLIFCVSIVCLCLDRLYRIIKVTAYPSLPPLWMNPSIDEPYQIVKLGNSHSEAGITFKKYKMKGLSLSGFAQRFKFDLVLLRQYSNQIAPGAIILIEASPISFSHRTADASDGLQGNYYNRVSPFLIPDLNWSNYAQVQLFPAVRSGYLLRKMYDEQVRQRIADEQKETPEGIISSEGKKQPLTVSYVIWRILHPDRDRLPEKKADDEATLALKAAQPKDEIEARASEFFSASAIEFELENPREQDGQKFIDNMNFVFHKWYETDEFDKKYFSENRRDLQKVIEYCLAHNWKPIIVTVPVSEVLQKGLLENYMQTYLYDNIQRTNTHGVEYMNFMNEKRIARDTYLFDNVDHLNPRGAVIFSYLLQQELIKKGYLPDDVNLYD